MALDPESLKKKKRFKKNGSVTQGTMNNAGRVSNDTQCGLEGVGGRWCVRFRKGKSSNVRELEYSPRSGFRIVSQEIFLISYEIM